MSYTILVIEDTPEIGLMLKISLEMSGWQVHQARSADEAFQVLEQHGDPDLIILDLGMPHVSGWGFLDQLRQRFPDKHIPVIVATAFINQAARAEQYPDVARFMQKPYSLKEMTAAVRDVLGIVV